jgi:hypothetical protein
MGEHVEWVDIRHPFFKVTVRAKGDEMPDGQLITEDFAVVIETDEILVFSGTAPRLRRFVSDLLKSTLEGLVMAPSEPAAPPAPAGHWLTETELAEHYPKFLKAVAAGYRSLVDALDAPEPRIWTTLGVTEDFEILGFQAPYVHAREKATNAEGSLTFSASPRYYFGWVPIE